MHQKDLSKKIISFFIISGLLLFNVPSFAQEEAGEAQAVPEPAASEAQEPVTEQVSNPEPETEVSEEEALKLKHQSMTEEELFNQSVSLDLRNIDVIEALKFLATKSGLNIVPTKNVSGRVSLSIENVPFRDVFDLMLRSNGLAYAKIGKIYTVMTEAEYKTFYGKNFYDLRQVKMLRLKYAIPEQAFTVLDALKSDLGRVITDKESGNVLIMDIPERIAQMEDSLNEFEKKNIVRVFTLNYARAKDVEDILRSRLDAKSVGSVKADERNNQVIVQTLSERMEEISELIASLDKITKEVLVDTKIVKIKLTDKLDTGLEWEGIFKISKAFGPTYIGTSPYSVMNAGTTTPGFTTRTEQYDTDANIAYYPFSGTTSTLNTSVKTSPGENLHFGMFGTGRDFDVLLNYLNTLGQTRVLANPKIVVVNNQEAKIHIGERQAYVTTTTTTGQSTSTVSEEVQFVDVGIQLSVTPIINDDGYIIMKIKPEISSVSSILTTPTNNKIPIIDTSLTETTVMMKDGTTLLIGGMRQEQKIHNSDGVPGISNIPFLGKLFKKASDETDRTELLVVITPHIISGNNFEAGAPRTIGDKFPKEFQDYKPITPDKSLLAPTSGGSGAVEGGGLQPKTYKNYLTFSENKGEEQ
ncbi:MAG: secretin N-terminal domain-containing protein [Candidatus Omnitrophica bacterium]|nr:secretin N-terminal domain-containing protein [Candidatus Omnitrophota bacterium]